MVTKRKGRQHRKPALKQLTGAKQRRRRLGLRLHLPRWLRQLRSHRLSPLGWAKVLADTQAEGERQSRSLTRLRRSYRNWLVLLAIPFVILAYLLVELSHSRLSLLLVLTSTLWFMVAARYAGSQLAFCRPPGAKVPLRHFHLPNALTLGRLLLLPLLTQGILVKDHNAHLAMLWFHFYLALAATDLLDGFLARRLRQGTDWGRLADHLTDVLFGAMAVAFMWAAGLLPAWFCALVLLRFAIPPLGGSWLYLRESALRIEPSPIGRATVLALAALGAAVMYPRALPAVDQVRDLLLHLTAALVLLNIGYLFYRGLRAKRAAQAPEGLNT